MGVFSTLPGVTGASALSAKRQQNSVGEGTSAETKPGCSELIIDEVSQSLVKSTETDGSDSGSSTSEEDVAEDEDDTVVPQLVPGLFPSTDDEASYDPPAALSDEHHSDTSLTMLPQKDESMATDDDAEQGALNSAHFTPNETLFVFDWDDTILPSSWISRQGLRLDSGSVVQIWQKKKLAEVAETAKETLKAAKKNGTVVLLTNAERGWIELSCTKFLPTLLPFIENVKIVSARTSYESPQCKMPLDWKVLAFEKEIRRACGADVLLDPLKRKNIFSIGDGVHEREALLRATEEFPNCCSKSLKLEERPDISQILRQHRLVMGSFEKLLHHYGRLDLSINSL